jgi:hypothetical protein
MLAGMYVCVNIHNLQTVFTMNSSSSSTPTAGRDDDGEVCAAKSIQCDSTTARNVRFNIDSILTTSQVADGSSTSPASSSTSTTVVVENSTKSAIVENLQRLVAFHAWLQLQRMITASKMTQSTNTAVHGKRYCCVHLKT